MNAIQSLSTNAKIAIAVIIGFFVLFGAYIYETDGDLQEISYPGQESQERPAIADDQLFIRYGPEEANSKIYDNPDAGIYFAFPEDYVLENHSYNNGFSDFELAIVNMENPELPGMFITVNDTALEVFPNEVWFYEKNEEGEIRIIRQEKAEGRVAEVIPEIDEYLVTQPPENEEGDRVQIVWSEAAGGVDMRPEFENILRTLKITR